MESNGGQLFQIGAGSLAAIVAIWALTHYGLRRNVPRSVDNPRLLFRELCRTLGLSGWEASLLTRLADRRGLSTPAMLFVRDDYFEVDDLGGEWLDLRDQLAALRAKLFSNSELGTGNSERTNRNADASVPSSELRVPSF